MDYVYHFTIMRMTYEEELKRPKLSQCALGLKYSPDRASRVLGIRIAKQTYDTCLSHSIINATQMHNKLDDLMHHVARIARIRGENRKDICIGVEAARFVVMKTIRNEFNVDRDNLGIAHVYLRNGEGHFVALKRIGQRLYLIDSSHGAAAEVTDCAEPKRRGTLYAIRDPIRRIPTLNYQKIDPNNLQQCV